MIADGFPDGREKSPAGAWGCMGGNSDRGQLSGPNGDNQLAEELDLIRRTIESYSRNLRLGMM
jgi:hypothetical protein